MDGNTSHTDAVGSTRSAPSVPVVDSVTARARTEKLARTSHSEGSSPGAPGLLADTAARPLPHTPLVTAWAELIERQRWDWYATLTFRRNVSTAWGHRRFRRWVHKINQGRYGRRYTRRGQGVPWLRCTEKQKRGAIHYHVLIGDCPDLHVEGASRDWLRLAGHAQLDRYVPGGGAAQYIAKRFAVDGGGCIDMGGIWHGA